MNFTNTIQLLFGDDMRWGDAWPKDCHIATNDVPPMRSLNSTGVYCCELFIEFLENVRRILGTHVASPASGGTFECDETRFLTGDQFTSPGQCT